MPNVPPMSSVKEIRIRPLGALLLCFALGAAACGGDDSSNGSNGTNGTNGVNGTNGTQPEDDVPDRVSYVDTLVIPEVNNGTPACCIDFGDRSKNPGVDNAFASLADQLSGFADLQTTVDESLEDGSQILLLNHVGLVDENDGFRLEGLLGEFAGATTYTEASAGTGTFTIDPSSFVGGEALISMQGDMEGGAMTAGPDDFVLSLPLGDVTITINVSEALLTGDATLDSETQVSYINGELSGYLLVDEIFNGLNAYLDAECECLGLDGDVFVQDGETLEWSANCAEDAGTCTESGCENIGTGLACGLLPTIMQSVADIDTNNDTQRYEGLSVGLQFTGQTATIVE